MVLKETAARLPVTTPEKATLEWMAKIFDWVESIQNAGQYNNEQLVIKIEHALEILEQGHNALYSVKDEVQSYLKGEKLGCSVSAKFQCCCNDRWDTLFRAGALEMGRTAF